MMKAPGKSDMQGGKYVLITPARDEEANIEKTIRSVISQTVLPTRWVIVSDGSTDRTDEIAAEYCKKYDWMDLVRMAPHGDRQFGAKVHSFNAGYRRVKGLEYSVIGNLDADISFEQDYFEFLLKKFAEDPLLGVAGTPFLEGLSHYDYRFTNIEHVSGACQLFRRECFEEIGGYIPINAGGIDWVAVTTARMKGWNTRTFLDKMCIHHRKIGTGNSGFLMASFRRGQEDYYLGGHPLWEVFRTLYQMKSKPYVIRGIFLASGYVWANLRGGERPVSDELIKFHRKEQMERLRRFFAKPLARGKVEGITEK
jgi:glycosyltransferase involved in cell wall biosynthesis